MMKKISLIRNLIGIIIGTLVAYIFAILLVNNVPTYISTYSPIFIGGIAASLLAPARPWIMGTIVAFLILAYFNWMLWAIPVANNPEFLKTIVNCKSILQLLLIPFGIAGAYLGKFIRTNRISKKIK